MAFVRKDVGSMTQNSPAILSYKAAVSAMRALPPSDPRSWAYQAAIHGSFVTPALTAWNSCQHNNYFFLSWHRMYLWYFERIVRKMSGDAAWALPFWNWESPGWRRLPIAFRIPSGAANPLYTTNRAPGWNNGSATLLPSAVDTSVAMGNVAFYGPIGFSNNLEGTPHGAVHVAIGGWMRRFETAAQDPIFWLHHCNIDRLWNAWLAKGGGRTDPLNDAAWRNTKFTFFDENGARVQRSACDILRAQKQLDYVYDGEPPQVELSCGPAAPAGPAFRFDDRAALRGSRPLTLPPERGSVHVTVDAGPVIEEPRGIVAEPVGEPVLDLQGVEADQQLDAYYEVYVGLPADEGPDAGSPHYVGNIAFFGFGVRGQMHHMHGHGEFMPADFTFKIGRAVAAARQRGALDSQLGVVFIPRSIARGGKPIDVRPTATIKIANIRFANLLPATP